MKRHTSQIAAFGAGALSIDNRRITGGLDSRPTVAA
jgi:hypothetical protein